MNVTEVARELDKIDWKALSGAYGPSHENVPNAILTLARERSAETDAWNDALDVLFSHVYHQGTLYEVTANVVPFVFDLLSSDRCADRKMLAHVLVQYAAAARDDDTFGPVVLARIAERRDTLLDWLDASLSEAAIFL